MDNKNSDASLDANFIKRFFLAMIVILPLVSALVTFSIYLASKPSREEVNEIINEKMKRLDRIEKQLDDQSSKLDRIIMNLK